VNLTARNTAIVLDSTSDFPGAAERFPNVRIVPLSVAFGTESFKDHVEIGPDEFYRRLREVGELPTTSQPTPHDFVEVFEQLDGYERVIALHLSSKLSGTFQSSTVAAAEIGGDRVHVVDTETASLAIGVLALAIQRRLDRGTDDEEITALIDRFKRESGVIFTVGTLEYLQKGGRIGRGQALAGTILKVKPIMSIDEGVVHPIGKVRGRQKALEEFARVFTEATEDRPGLRLAIAHADAPEWIEPLTDMAAKQRPQAELELVASLGAVVGTHAGPGAVGFFWFQD
jgi:DegV family protein with EDD domain